MFLTGEHKLSIQKNWKLIYVFIKKSKFKLSDIDSENGSEKLLDLWIAEICGA